MKLEKKVTILEMVNSDEKYFDDSDDSNEKNCNEENLNEKN